MSLKTIAVCTKYVKDAPTSFPNTMLCDQYHRRRMLVRCSFYKCLDLISSTLKTLHNFKRRQWFAVFNYDLHALVRVQVDLDNLLALHQPLYQVLKREKPLELLLLLWVQVNTKTLVCKKARRCRLRLSHIFYLFI